MTLEERAALKAAAEAATPTWIVTAEEPFDEEGDDTVKVTIRASGQKEWADDVLQPSDWGALYALPQDAAFLAHVSPEKILALLTELEEAYESLHTVRWYTDRIESLEAERDEAERRGEAWVSQAGRQEARADRAEAALKRVVSMTEQLIQSNYGDEGERLADAHRLALRDISRPLSKEVPHG